MEARNWRWVSRDSDSDMVYAFTEAKPPEPLEEDDAIIFDGFILCSMLHDEFLALTGIHIQPGTCRKVEFTAKVLEE